MSLLRIGLCLIIAAGSLHRAWAQSPSPLEASTAISTSMDSATPESQHVRPLDSESVYEVVKLRRRMRIDADWGKRAWRRAGIVDIARHMGPMPRFVPKVEARMAYDAENVYVIFRVQDRYVRSLVRKVNGPVSTDSCVEFFFAPDGGNPLHYFNLEVNAGGTPLIFWITKPMTEVARLKPEEIAGIEIAHSLPEVVDPEMEGPVTWTVECRIPLALLRTYTGITDPGKGSRWKGNFYKTGSRTSNPNYMTWAQVDFPRPNFHLPQFFGTLVFR